MAFPANVSAPLARGYCRFIYSGTAIGATVITKLVSYDQSRERERAADVVVLTTRSVSMLYADHMGRGVEVLRRYDSAPLMLQHHSTRPSCNENALTAGIIATLLLLYDSIPCTPAAARLIPLPVWPRNTTLLCCITDNNSRAVRQVRSGGGSGVMRQENRWVGEAGRQASRIKC